jgi:hypothetical protein
VERSDGTSERSPDSIKMSCGLMTQEKELGQVNGQYFFAFTFQQGSNLIGCRHLYFGDIVFQFGLMGLYLSGSPSIVWF